MLRSINTASTTTNNTTSKQILPDEALFLLSLSPEFFTQHGERLMKNILIRNNSRRAQQPLSIRTAIYC
jgi:hypothetical protein